VQIPAIDSSALGLSKEMAVTKETTGRRHFLVGSASAALAIATASPSGRASTQRLMKSMALEGKMPRLLLGLCASSFGPLFKTGEMTYESFFQTAIGLKAEAVDMTLYYLKSTEPTYLRHLRNLAFRNGLAFTGAACGATLLPPSRERQVETLNELKRWIDVTEQLAAPHLRIFAGKPSPEMSQADAESAAVEMFKQAAGYAAEKGIVLGLENQKRIAQTADACLSITHRVDSLFAGINLDITHFVPTPSLDTYAQITACVPVATHSHIRSGSFDDGTPIDLNRICRIFAEAGYRGYMSVEYESLNRSAAEIYNDVPKLMDETRRFCQIYSSV
jgi:sugar phosphate isomerase/epimerase